MIASGVICPQVIQFETVSRKYSFGTSTTLSHTKWQSKIKYLTESVLQLKLKHCYKKVGQVKCIIFFWSADLLISFVLFTPSASHLIAIDFRLVAYSCVRVNNQFSFLLRNTVFFLHLAAPSSSSRMFVEQDQSSKRNYSERDKVHKSLSSSLRRSMDGNDNCSYISTDATKEYEDAMKSLRRKPTALPSSPVSVLELSDLLK